MNFGIIGYGRFGKLWAEVLSSFGNVLVYDKNKSGRRIRSGRKSASGLKPEYPVVPATLGQTAQTDVLFMLVPISEMENSCKAVKKYLSPKTLVADACSVKVIPVNIMKTVLPARQSIVATHPLFGPDSVRRSGGVAGHKIVVCPVRSSRERTARLFNLFRQIGLEIVISTPQIHDRQMARSQSLVHFIGRGLQPLRLGEQKIATPDYHSLLQMSDMVVHDTFQLFFDMQKFNPYAAPVRRKFLKSLMALESQINEP